MIENMTIGRAVEFAVTTEQIGQEVYRRLSERHLDDAELSQLFARLADDEELHEAQLRDFRRDLSDDERQELSEEESNYLHSLARSDVFFGDQNPLAEADSVTEREDALQIALNLERSTLLYYNGLREVLGEHDVLRRIIDMEKRHLTQVIKYMMVPESKMRGVSDQWA